MTSIRDLLTGADPDVALLSPEGESWSYGRLRQILGQSRIRLRALGVGPEDRVVVAARGGPLELANLLAIASSASCVLISPQTRPSELQALCRELQPAAILGFSGEPGTIALAAGPGGPRVIHDPGRDPVGDRETSGRVILATSGTTGLRKWVELTPAEVARGAASVADGLGLTADDCSLCLMPLHHAHGLVLSTLAALVRGGRVLLPEAFASESFPDWIRRWQPTWYSASPSWHRAVLESTQGHGWPSLRRIRSSAGPLDEELRKALEERFGLTVQEGYGMTEFPQISLQAPGHGKPGSVGRPGPHVELRGEEIWVRGDQGWFATGDLGRLDEEGNLSLRGRVRDLVNRGGEKVPPAEVDRVLLTYPGVAEAACFGVPHPRLGEDLVAAVTARPGIRLDPDAIRCHLAQRVVDAWVPSRVEVRERLPKTDTGKVLRRVLRDEWMPPENDESPLTGTEQQLLPIWGEILKTARPSFKGTFLELGGDSILAAQLVTRIERTLGKRLDLSDVLANPTLRGLARLLDGQTPSRTPARRPGLKEFARGRKQARPLRFSLFFFSADGSGDSPEKYGLLLDAARFADAHGFEAVWVPERHFDPFGGLYPDPSVLAAALAVVTKTVQIRAGSVVVPLWDPLRLVENWSVVDNLSGGRVGVACASGWHPNDFALAPESYAGRRELALKRMETALALWRGGALERRNGAGKTIETRCYPKPLQAELPCWLAAHSLATMLEAARRGWNLLTVLYDTSPEALESDLAAFRAAGGKQITVMLHTLLGDGLGTKVRESYTHYLVTNLDLQRSYAEGLGTALELRGEDRRHILEEALLRLDQRALVGTPADRVHLCRRLQAMGVDEIACLVDFGPDRATVLDSLTQIVKLRESLQ